MRIIPTYVHGMCDYLAGIVLIAMPWLLGFASGPAMWVPTILGIAIIAYSLFTAYELGAFPTIPMSTHLILDVVGGVILAASPWIFQFHEIVWGPHVLLGLAEVLAAAMTQTEPRREAMRI